LNLGKGCAENYLLAKSALQQPHPQWGRHRQPQRDDATLPHYQRRCCCICYAFKIYTYSLLSAKAFSKTLLFVLCLLQTRNEERCGVLHDSAICSRVRKCFRKISVFSLSL